MGKSVSVLSPAKINLHLDIGEKRADGFHDLLSVFQMISLYDKIRVSELEGEGEVEIGGFDFPTEDNILYKALKLFREETGYSRSLSIDVEKQIPQGGGLGGGSSNAAFLLKALMEISGHRVEKERLFEMAAHLGSDVPFFLGSAAALVQGRGEVLKPLKARTDYKIALIIPDFSVHTGKAFAALADSRKEEGAYHPYDPSRLEEIYSTEPVQMWEFHNSFLNCIKKEHNVLEHIVNLFYYAGADFAGMSGSGSTMFGIFSEQKDCKSTLVETSGTFGRMLFVNPLDTAGDAALQSS